jgi:hypothetical protein
LKSVFIFGLEIGLHIVIRCLFTLNLLMSGPKFFRAECPFCKQPVDAPKGYTEWIDCPNSYCGNSFPPEAKSFAHHESQSTPQVIPVPPKLPTTKGPPLMQTVIPCQYCGTPIEVGKWSRLNCGAPEKIKA